MPSENLNVVARMTSQPRPSILEKLAWYWIESDLSQAGISVASASPSQFSSGVNAVAGDEIPAFAAFDEDTLRTWRMPRQSDH